MAHFSARGLTQFPVLGAQVDGRIVHSVCELEVKLAEVDSDGEEVPLCTRRTGSDQIYYICGKENQLQQH